MKDKISVIIPVYKVEKYLDRCVESVVNQTYKNLEIILVDDGSPDNCPVMCDEWAKKDKRIKVIHKKNGGLSDARNAGIEVATGEYIMFLDSDDFVSIDICKRLYELLKKHNTFMSACGNVKFFESEKFPEVRSDVEEQYFSKEQTIEQIYNPTIELLMTAWAKLYKKETFKEIRYPVGKLHEDEFVIHEVLLNIDSFVYTNEQMYFYLQRQNSIMGTKKEKNVVDTFEAIKNRFNYLNEKLPENTEKNKNYYLRLLRGLSVTRTWASKNLKKEIFIEYKKVYKETEKKSLKEKFFRFFPNLFGILARKKLRRQNDER